MGQKVHPNGLRVGFFRKWNTTWFVEKNKYSSLFFAQQHLEKFLKTFFHFYSYTKNSATKKVALVDLKWFRTGNSQIYFFVFFYKMRTRKRRWGFLSHGKRKPRALIQKKHKKYISQKLTFLVSKIRRKLQVIKNNLQ